MEEMTRKKNSNMAAANYHRFLNNLDAVIVIVTSRSSIFQKNIGSRANF